MAESTTANIKNGRRTGLLRQMFEGGHPCYMLQACKHAAMHQDQIPWTLSQKQPHVLPIWVNSRDQKCLPTQQEAATHAVIDVALGNTFHSTITSSQH